MGEELGRDFHVRNDKRRVQEGVNRSRATDCAFRKGGIRLVINALQPPYDSNRRRVLPICSLPKRKRAGETVPVPALLASRCIEQLLKPRGAFKRRVHRLLSVLMLVRLKALALLPFHTPHPAMIIGDRLREMREQKKLSQGDFQYPAPTTSMCPWM